MSALAKKPVEAPSVPPGAPQPFQFRLPELFGLTLAFAMAAAAARWLWRMSQENFGPGQKFAVLVLVVASPAVVLMIGGLVGGILRWRRTRRRADDDEAPPATPRR